MDICTRKWLCLIAVLVEVQWAQGKSTCNFPKHLRGRWHQSHLGDVTISSNVISGKGLCTNNQRGYYLLHDQDRGCFTCLLLFQRHKNVIQYRETHCLPISSFWQLCKSLAPEAPLYTLIKDAASSITCPFKGAYRLIYNNNTQGSCSHPRSYVKPCAGDAIYHFRFQACFLIPDTFDKDLELQCLANWKVGSDKFLYGRFAGGSIGIGDKHRCFMYEHKGSSDILMTMSADSSCQGLRSSQDGPLTIELANDEHWVSPSCTFPEYIHRRTWTDISGKHRYEISADGTSLQAVHRRNTNQKNRVSLSYQCLATFPNDPEVFEAASLTSHGCSSHYQCLSIQVLAAGVISISQGTILNHPPNYCHLRDANDSTILLIDEAIVPSPCPYQGAYSSSNIDPTVPEICTRHVEFGCNSTSVMSAKQNCQTSSASSMMCVTHWRSEDKRYLILRDSNRLEDDLGPSMRCLILQETLEGLLVTSDSKCNAGGNTHSILEYFQEKALEFDGYCGENQASYLADSNNAQDIHHFKLSISLCSILIVSFTR